MDLGLEHLTTQKDDPVVLSFEDLFNEIEFSRLSDEVGQELSNITTLFSTYDTLCEIGCTIKKYGVTESLVDIFGQNYSGAASMEAENEEAKEGVLKRIWEAIKAFFQKIVAWFKALFQSNVKVIKALGELKRKADTIEYPVKVPVTIVKKYQFAIAAATKFAQYVTTEKNLDSEATIEEKFKEFFGSHMSEVIASMRAPDDDSKIKNSDELKYQIDLLIDILEAVYKTQKNFSVLEETMKRDIEKAIKANEEQTGKEAGAAIKTVAWTARKVAIAEIWTILKAVNVHARQTANLLLSNAKPAKSSTEEKQ